MQTVVSIIMGSRSDWSTMSHTADTLDRLGIGYEVQVISAHRAPDRLSAHCRDLRQRGIKIVIAGAGLAAALPGVVAAATPLPVLGVPMQAGALDGLDALLSIVQMPPGIPVGTLAIGKPGAINAALLAAAILALSDPALAAALDRYRAEQTRQIEENPDPRTPM